MVATDRAGSTGLRADARPAGTSSRGRTRLPTTSLPTSPNNSASTSRQSAASIARSCGKCWATARSAPSCRCTSPTSCRGCAPGWKRSGSAKSTSGGRLGRSTWDHATDPSDIVFNDFLPTVARQRALDALTAEVVRLRGATQHNCRLCKSLRETTALDAGGSETLYGDIEKFEASAQLTERHKAALRYVDALIWSPSRIDDGVAAGVRAHFSDAEARRADPRRDAQCQQQESRWRWAAMRRGSSRGPSSIYSTPTVRRCSPDGRLPAAARFSCCRREIPRVSVRPCAGGAVRMLAAPNGSGATR